MTTEVKTQTGQSVPPIVLEIDSRGEWENVIAKYLLDHKQIAKRFSIVTGQFSCDVKASNRGKSFVFELKKGKDLPDSLPARLGHEIQETYLPLLADYKYVLACDAPNYKLSIHDLNWLNSEMDKWFPGMRHKTWADSIKDGKIVPASDSLLWFMLKLIYDAEEPRDFSIPVDTREESKNLICAVSRLCDGVTPALVKFLFEYPKHEPFFRTLRDLTVTEPNKVQTLCEEIFYQYYGQVEHKKLAADFVAALHNPYHGGENDA